MLRTIAESPSLSEQEEAETQENQDKEAQDDEVIQIALFEYPEVGLAATGQAALGPQWPSGLPYGVGHVQGGAGGQGNQGKHGTVPAAR